MDFVILNSSPGIIKAYIGFVCSEPHKFSILLYKVVTSNQGDTEETFERVYTEQFNYQTENTSISLHHYVDQNGEERIAMNINVDRSLAIYSHNIQKRQTNQIKRLRDEEYSNDYNIGNGHIVNLAGKYFSIYFKENNDIKYNDEPFSREAWKNESPAIKTLSSIGYTDHDKSETYCSFNNQGRNYCAFPVSKLFYVTFELVLGEDGVTPQATNIIEQHLPTGLEDPKFLLIDGFLVVDALLRTIGRFL